MKRLLVAAAFVLAPTAAFADVITGTVQVTQPMCFRAPCPKQVRLVGADGSSHAITGELRDDVVAFNGRTITVKANDENGLLDVQGFAPGKSANFVTGRVELVSPRCPANARCAPKVYLNEGGRKILVPAPDSFKLHALAGALVTIRGNVVQTRCAPGVRCMGSEPTLHPTPDRNLMVRGRLEKLPHGMNGQTHTLTFENGQSLLVSGREWADRDGATVWLNGKMDFERISGQPMLDSSFASQPVVGEPQICFPFGPNGADGSNVGRNNDTDGGVVAGGSPAGGDMSAGTRR